MSMVWQEKEQSSEVGGVCSTWFNACAQVVDDVRPDGSGYKRARQVPFSHLLQLQELK